MYWKRCKQPPLAADLLLGIRVLDFDAFFAIPAAFASTGYADRATFVLANNHLDLGATGCTHYKTVAHFRVPDNFARTQVCRTSETLRDVSVLNESAP
jgi:hypothetical protein